MLTCQEKHVNDNKGYNRPIHYLRLNNLLHKVTPLDTCRRRLQIQALLLFFTFSLAASILTILISAGPPAIFILTLLALALLITIILFIKEAILLFLLHLELLLKIDLVLNLLLPPLFFIKGCTQVSKLHSNHEIQHEESTKKHTSDEEGVVAVGPFAVSNDVHHLGPPLECDDLEDVDDTDENVVKLVSVSKRVLVVFAPRVDTRRLPINTILICHTKYFFLFSTQEMRFHSEYINSEASVLQSST